MTLNVHLRSELYPRRVPRTGNLWRWGVHFQLWRWTFQLDFDES